MPWKKFIQIFSCSFFIFWIFTYELCKIIQLPKPLPRAILPLSKLKMEGGGGNYLQPIYHWCFNLPFLRQTGNMHSCVNKKLIESHKQKRCPIDHPSLITRENINEQWRHKQGNSCT